MKSWSYIPDLWTPLSSSAEQEVGVDTLMQRMKSLSEKSEEFTQEEKTKRYGLLLMGFDYDFAFR